MSLEPYRSAAEHLAGEFGLLNLRLHRRVLEWRAEHHPQATPDELAGLYASEADVAHLINGLYAHQPAPGAETSLVMLDRLIDQAGRTHAAREATARAAPGGDAPRLALLVERLGLNALERGALVLALAAECDRRYERLFGYLNDDLTQKLPTPALALALFVADARDRPAAMAAFTPDAPLRDLRLIRLVDGPPAALAGSLFRLEDGPLAFLLEGQTADPLLRAVADDPGASWQAPAPPDEPALPAALDEAAATVAAQPHIPFVVNLHGPDVLLRRRAAASLAARLGVRLLPVDGQALAATDPEDRLRRIRRQRRLLAGVVALEEPAGRPAVSLWLELIDGARLTLLLTDAPWHDEAHPPATPVLRVAVPPPDADARRRLWLCELDDLAAETDLLELADRFRLDTGQIAAASAAVRAASAVTSHPPSQADLFAICREQLSRELRGFAQVVQTPFGWDDLILPAPVKAQVMALEAWVRHRHTVLREWGFGRQTAAHGGLSALFSGPSGVGKSLSAGILGRSLGLDVYRVDLSAVVSKYIGETEKNLERIFTLAAAANAILFFDEADALFGKRSEVQDAHDRYANIEVSYLLQRMESYPGLAILTSNFKQNIDNAFLRRFQVVVEFPFPQTEERETLWRAMLPAEAPLGPDVDLPFLARQFALTGGNIKNCILAAAYAAVDAGRPIGMADLIRAVAAELEKLEQPLLRSEFGIYYDSVYGLLPSVNGGGGT